MPNSYIKNNILNLRAKIAPAMLLAVSKAQSIEKIQEAIACDQKDFGENYLQEALAKITAINNKNIAWHFIGRIQSNKTKEIAENFSWVASVPSLKIAELLNKYRPTNLSPLNICLQLNISNEASKSGVLPQGLLSLALATTKLSRLKLRGIMTIPAQHNDFQMQLKTFQEVATEFARLNANGFALDTAAIAAGATMIRIGTKIFGKR